MLKDFFTCDGCQEHIGLDVPINVVVAVRLERRSGAADGLEGVQLVALDRFDAAVLLNSDPLGRSSEYSDAALVNLNEKSHCYDRCTRTNKGYNELDQRRPDR